MNDKVVPFTGVTTLDQQADQILEQAQDQLEAVVIIGYNKEGNEYFASSIADGAEVLWLLERAKHALMQVNDE